MNFYQMTHVARISSHVPTKNVFKAIGCAIKTRIAMMEVTKKIVLQ